MKVHFQAGQGNPLQERLDDLANQLTSFSDQIGEIFQNTVKDNIATLLASRKIDFGMSITEVSSKLYLQTATCRLDTFEDRSQKNFIIAVKERGNVILIVSYCEKKSTEGAFSDKIIFYQDVTEGINLHISLRSGLSWKDEIDKEDCTMATDREIMLACNGAKCAVERAKCSF